jgi:hypothetical protein
MKIILCIAALFLSMTVLAQNVGIGTTAPTGRLQINHRTTGTATGLRLVDSAVATAGSIEFRNIGFARRMLLSGFSESNFNNGQYLDIQSDSMYVASFRGNGTVGIRNSTPAYPLDVTGDINTTGALRVGGNAGAEGQVLRSNGNGTMAWSDVTEYKNFNRFLFTTTGAIQNWVVPAGVTRVKAEAWGGGGYGTHIFLLTGETSGAGGGGGGYVCAYFTVTPGETLNIIVGAGGTSGIRDGGQSSFTSPLSGANFAALGGIGANYNSSAIRFESGEGGSFSGNRPTHFGMNGQSGTSTITYFEQRSATEFIRRLVYGNGGNAANTSYTGGTGGVLMLLVGGSSLLTSTGTDGGFPGGGGSSMGSTGAGSNGAPGAVIIYW